MDSSIDADLELLEAAADPTRLAILRELASTGPTCACDVGDGRGISQSTVSHHLKVLRQSGWVMGERRGTWIWYSIRPEAVRQLEAIASDLSGGQPRPLQQSEVDPEDAVPPTQRDSRDHQPAWRQW
jgi:ArsR family transcriptional regulator